MILVTGAAGFIGFHLCQRLLSQGHEVIGLDNLNDYYSVDLKQSRLAQLTPHGNFQFYTIDLADQAAIEDVFSKHTLTTVIHLAAQAGVRYSLQNPQSYISSNLVGFFHVIEAARAKQVVHFVFASTSSVYGSNTKMPFSTSDNTDHPVSLYAATKKSNEAIAHSYAYMHGLPVTGLRFFTVYGPWGRPDMAYFLFADAIAKGGKLETGGKALSGQFFEPTVISGATADMACAREETFGPFAPIFKFHTEKEAIDAANNTEFGLASYFYSRDVGRIYRVAEALEYGMVGINVGILATEHVPFGGVKQSGLGREGSHWGMDDYLEMKYLCIGDVLK
jgi:UDP-glucuronate 4-epimerase